MITRRTGLVLGAASLGLVVSACGTARAQGHTPDPYNIVGEYNRQYEPYMYATVPNMPGVLPNQERLEGRSGVRSANQFQRYLESDEGDLDELGRPSLPRMAGPGTPYWRANRQFDQEFGRLYRPNREANQSYYAEQRQRQEKYFQAMREKDPRKRAQLLREYNLETLRAARSQAAGRNTPDRDRLRSPDRFGTEDEEPSAPSRALTPRSAAPPRRPGGLTTAPPPPGGSSLLPRSFGSSTAGTRPRAPGTAPPPPPGSRSRTTRPGGSAPSDVLDRSRLLDRANRLLNPSGTDSSAPPPPR